MSPGFPGAQLSYSYWPCASPPALMLRKTPIEVAPRLGVKGAAIASNVKPKMTIHQLVEKIKPKLVEDDSVSLVLHSHKKDGRVLLPEMQLSDALKEQGNPEALRLFYSFEVEDSAEQFALSVLADGSSSAQASAAGTSAEAELAADESAETPAAGPAPAAGSSGASPAATPAPVLAAAEEDGEAPPPCLATVDDTSTHACGAAVSEASSSASASASASVPIASSSSSAAAAAPAAGSTEQTPAARPKLAVTAATRADVAQQAQQRASSGTGAAPPPPKLSPAALPPASRAIHESPGHHARLASEREIDSNAVARSEIEQEREQLHVARRFEYVPPAAPRTAAVQGSNPDVMAAAAAAGEAVHRVTRAGRQYGRLLTPVVHDAAQQALRDLSREESAHEWPPAVTREQATTTVDPARRSTAYFPRLLSRALRRSACSFRNWSCASRRCRASL